MATSKLTLFLFLASFAGLAFHARGAVASSLDSPDERMDVTEDTTTVNATTTNGRKLLSTPCRRRRSAVWLAAHPRRYGPDRVVHHERPRLPYCDEVDQEVVAVAAAPAAPAAPVYSRTLTDRDALFTAVQDCSIINPDTQVGRVWNKADTVNCDIATWDVSAVTEFNSIFFGSKSVAFNEDISKWDVSSGTIFRQMFNGAAEFNQDISGWDVSKGTEFHMMFEGAAKFNADISGWDVSKGTSFSSMFQGATVFNADISGWDVSKCQSFNEMFNDAAAFDKDITKWNDPLATTEFFQRDMFKGATAFLAKYERPNLGTEFGTSPHGPASKWSLKTR